MHTLKPGITKFPKIEATKFEELPLDLQRSMIDWCIEHRTLVGRFGGQSFSLPKYIQIVVFCKECGEADTLRFLTVDVVHEQLRPSRRCYRCKEGYQEVRHMTAVLDYSLIRRRRKRGLERHLSDRAREMTEVLPFGYERSESSEDVLD